MSEIEAERNLYKGKYRALLKLISRTRSQLVHVTDHIEDEGDRAYFGSTNDADALKALYREMMSWIWDATDETNRMKADPYATIRELRTRIAALEAENERLRKALDEIDVAASAAYCASLRQFEKDECLGWVRKVEAGKFGEAEHKAHQQANMLMGKSQGLWEALKIARAALEAKP